MLARISTGVTILGLWIACALGCDGRATRVRPPREEGAAGSAPAASSATDATDASAANSVARNADAAPAPGRGSDEADVALRGTQILVAMHKIQDPDAPALEPTMRAAYARMRADEDDPAALVRLRRATLPAGDGTDVLLYEPRARQEGDSGARTAVVFLHGYGGRFALPCWQLARAAAAAAPTTTACPTIGSEGDWWTKAGEARVAATVEALRREGYARFILAGLSNGAIGASRLAPRMPGRPFAALVLVSGADPAAPPSGLPTLVLQGTRDAMSSANAARVYATASHATYIQLDAGHFAMLTRSEQADAALRAFVDKVALAATP